MKQRIIILFILIAALSVSAGCGMVKLDTDEVKVIDKPKSSDQAPKEKDNGASNESNAPDPGKSDLDEKKDVLKGDTEEYIKSIIKGRATEVLTALKNYDMDKFSQMVHPDKGVRFSPYAYVQVEKDVVFSPDKIKALGEDNEKYLWGIYDGSGEPIELTFEDYHKKFIYDADFINAEEVGYNKKLSQGNTIDNSAQVYKNSIIVEYHFSGFDPQYAGMDWKSLRLVFEKKNGTWFIVGVIHDQWTI